jgi:hypothetical protein
MGERSRKKHQYQMNRETGNAYFDGQPFEQGLVGLRKDLIVSSNQLQPESGDLQRMTMVQSGLHSSYGCSDFPGELYALIRRMHKWRELRPHALPSTIGGPDRPSGSVKFLVAAHSAPNILLLEMSF